MKLREKLDPENFDKFSADSISEYGFIDCSASDFYKFTF